MQSATPLGLRERLHLLLQQAHILAIVRQIAGRTPPLPVLQPLAHHRLIIPIIRRSKGILHLGGLLDSAYLILYRLQFALVVDEARVVLLLWHLGEVAALAQAHGHLSVRAFHVLVQRLCRLLCLAVDAFEHFLEAVVDRVDVVLASVLYGQALPQSCNAGRLSELLLVANLAEVGRALLT